MNSVLVIISVFIHCVTLEHYYSIDINPLEHVIQFWYN